MIALSDFDHRGLRGYSDIHIYGVTTLLIVPGLAAPIPTALAHIFQAAKV